MNKNFQLVRGDDKILPLNITKTEANGNISPVDLTDSIIFLTIKKTADLPDNEAYLEYSQTTHADPVNGISILHLSNILTHSLPIGKFKYDIQIKFSTGIVQTPIIGTVEVLGDITRRTS
jgi:hypothetical protein